MTTRFLLHTGLLIAAGAVAGLFFNLAVLAFGFDRTLLGTLTSAGTLGAALLGAPLWWLTTRIALRTALIINALVQALGLLVMAAYPTYWTLLLVSGGTGAATVLYQLAAQPLMLQLAEGSARDRIFSQQQAILIGGAGLGALVGGGLPGALGMLSGAADPATRYRLTFALAGGLALLSVLPLLWVRSASTTTGSEQDLTTEGAEHAEAGNQNRFRPLRALRVLCGETWVGLWLKLLTPSLLVSCGAALLVPYLNLFFAERFALGDAALGTLFALLGVGTGLATLGAPWLAARLGRLRTLVLTEAAGLVFLIALGLAGSLPLAVFAALCRSALFNLARPLYEAYALEQVSERQRTLMVAGLGVAQSAGYVVAPLISVQIQASYGFGPVFALTTACYSVAVLLEYWWFVRGRGRV